MAPIAAGFMVMVAAATVLGIAVGAIGGAIAWWARINIALGGFLTAGALVLFEIVDAGGDLHWLNAKLGWGAPAMIFTYLAAWVFARLLQIYTALRAAWIAVAAFVLSLAAGLVCSKLVGLESLIVAALTADAVLILVLLVLGRKRTASPT